METEILNYIEAARSHGLSETEIKQNLLDVGWDPGQVEDSFNFAKVPGKASQDAQILIKPQQNSVPAQIKTSNVQPNSLTALNESNFNAGQPKKSKTGIIIAVVIVFLLGLGAGGYFAYGYYFPNAQKIWTKAVANAVLTSRIYSLNFDFSYADPANMESKNKINFGLAGDVYIDSSKTDRAEFDTKFNVNYAYNGISGTKSFGAMQKDNALYFDLSSLNELTSFIGQQFHWIKLDYNKLQEYLSSEQGYNLEKQTALRKKIQEDIKLQWQKNPPVTATKILGSETVSGVPTYHIQNKFNQDAFAEMVFKLVDDAQKSYEPSTTEPSLSDKQKSDFKAELGKLEFKTLETWVGKKDNQIYKVSIDILGPSSSENSSVNNGTPNDIKRVTNIKYLNTALEMYHNDHMGYPPAVNGVPQDLAPKYIDLVPKAPEPAEGKCNDYYNSYWYSPTGTQFINEDGLAVYPSYEITFCLSADTETEKLSWSDTFTSLKGGIGKATPGQIVGGLPCTEQMGNCPTETSSVPVKKVQPPQSELKLTLILSDIGKQKDINPPADALDIIQWFQNKTKPSAQMIQPTDLNKRDQIRVADTRQIAMALELYFNDFSKYPANLSDMVPKYIGAIPAAPMPADGVCTDNLNLYQYSQIKNGADYNFKFCLGGDIASYKAGPHSMTMMGIQ